MRCPTSKRDNPEFRFQKHVNRFLILALPDECEWTFSLTGTYLSPYARMIAKAAGVRPDWPDGSILYRGVTYFLECKSLVGSLSPGQRRFRDRCAPYGIFATVKTLEQVEAALIGWGIPLRARLSILPPNWLEDEDASSSAGI